MELPAKLTIGILVLVVPAAAESQWPEHVDVDLNYRNSALLGENQHWDFRLGAGLELEPTFQGSNSLPGCRGYGVALAQRP